MQREDDNKNSVCGVWCESQWFNPLRVAWQNPALKTKQKKAQLWAFHPFTCFARYSAMLQKTERALQFDYSKIRSDGDVICVSRSGLYLLNPFVFAVRSAPALQCSRFVYKLWKPHVHMVFEACWLKRLLQHMGSDISSYACQAHWILSCFISINNKQRQTPPTDTACFIREEKSLMGRDGLDLYLRGLENLVVQILKLFINRNSTARNAYVVILLWSCGSKRTRKTCRQTKQCRLPYVKKQQSLSFQVL